MSSVVRRVLLGAAFVLVLVLAIFGRRGTADADGPPPPPGDPLAEPITGEVVMPEPGAETGPLQPFLPPPHGSSDVDVDDLSADEQAYVAAGVDVSGWDDVHAGFSAATAQAAELAAAEAAANELGFAGFSDAGVVVP